MEARAYVYGGEVVIAFDVASPYGSTSKGDRIRAFSSEFPCFPGRTYTVHKGQFKFHYKKFIAMDVSDENSEPNFEGEFFIDGDFRARVGNTQVQL